MSAVALDNVSFAYDQRPVLSKVTCAFDQQCIGIIGPNGGGKTTLFRLILGLLTPTQGRITLFGQSPVLGRKEAAYVPQTLHFDQAFPMTVNEVVLSGLLRQLSWTGRYTTQQKKRALEALDRVGMEEQARASFASLSGGQRQRVLIARALVAQPKLLLLDEPTANVDSAAEGMIHELLQQLKKELTILWVTHNLHVATQLVDRVLCVQNRVDLLEPDQVCEHFAIGIYHHPLSSS